MNLSMDVLRWLTVRAVRGRTWAGMRVFDSPSQPADIRTEHDKDPFIAVYVDDADADMAENPSLENAGEAIMTLVLEVGVASPKRFDGDQPADDNRPQPGVSVSQLNATDEGLEAQIGFISRQAVQALLSTHESNPWAELWRMLVAGGIKHVAVRRGGPSVDTGKPQPRYASRVTLIKVACLGEPPRGDDLANYPFWRTFLAAISGDDEWAGIGDLIRAHIERPSGVLPDWRLAQKFLTIPVDTVRAIGLGPVDGFDELIPQEEGAKLEEIKLVEPDPPAVFDPWQGLGFGRR